MTEYHCTKCGWGGFDTDRLYCKECGEVVLKKNRMLAGCLIPWDEEELEHGYCTQCFYVGWSATPHCPICLIRDVKFWLWPLDPGVLYIQGVEIEENK